MTLRGTATRLASVINIPCCPHIRPKLFAALSNVASLENVQQVCPPTTCLLVQAKVAEM